MTFDPTLPPVIVAPRDDRIRHIVSGLFPGHEIAEFAPVGLSLRKAPPADLDMAMASAVRHGGWLKRAFLNAQNSWLWHRLRDLPPSTVISWNGIKGHRRLAMEAAQALGHQTIYLEEAPFPGRISIDPQGVNAGNSLPRAPDHYLDWTGEAPADWRALRDQITPRVTARRDVGQTDAGENLGQSPYIFAPLQVPGDSQITIYGDWIKSVDHMIRAIVAAAGALPDGWYLRIKEHPSAKVSFADLLGSIGTKRVVLDNDTNTFQQVAASRGVVTINSSVGLQAMLWEKPVLALGDAFWGWEPLAARARSEDELTAHFAAPGWGFDATLRDRFLSYLLNRAFPLEEDVVSGRVSLSNLPFAL